jgi:hypothetical protein
MQKSQSARTGKLVSAQILIKGTVTEYSSSVSASGQKIRVGGIAFGKNKSVAHIGLMLRMIDTTTGEVLDSERVEAKVHSGGNSVNIRSGGLGWGKETKTSPNMQQATHEVIAQAVEQIATKLEDIPFQARIIKASSGTVYISAGAKDGAAIGDQFIVNGVGEEMVDPMTGESLGADEEQIGTVKITQVKEKCSKAQPIGALANAKPGDIVRQN